MKVPPKVFENEKALRFLSSDYRQEIKKVDFESFPLIDDFKVEVFDTESFMGLHLRFISEKFGILTSFPWWDNVDAMMARVEEFIPLG